MTIKDLQTSVAELTSKCEKISVVILCEKLQYTSEDKHVIDTALALVSYGHKVVIFANKNNLRKEYNKIKKKLEVIIIGKFIPKSIFGYFQNPLLSIWSIYAALFTSIFKPKGNTNIIFCDKNVFALPILNFLGSYKIIQFHNLYSYNIKSCEKDKTKLSKSWMDLRSIKFANELLLPNKASHHFFERNYDKFRVNKTILYPCICTNYSMHHSTHYYAPLPKRFLLPNIPLHSVIFVVFGEFHPSSNFELAINALAILTRKVRKRNIIKMQLVIVANYDKQMSSEQHKYCVYLMYLCESYKLLENVTFLNSLHSFAKTSLISYSVAMLHTTVSDIYNRNILEAMSLSKPVIAANSEFALEVLEHGITGYIIPPEPIRFAEIMHEIIYNPTTTKMMGKAAYVEYQNKYSFTKFAKGINKLVLKYNVKSQIEKRNKLNREKIETEGCMEVIEEYMNILPLF